MHRSYRVVVSYAVFDEIGFKCGNFYYSEIHHKVIRPRQAYEEATEKIIKVSEDKFGKGCRIEFMSEFRFLHPDQPDKSLRVLNDRTKPEKMKQAEIFTRKVAVQEKRIVQETQEKLYSRSLLVRRTKWDLMKDEMTNEEIVALKNSPFEPEKHWALQELKRRFKKIYDDMQLKLFP